MGRDKENIPHDFKDNAEIEERTKIWEIKTTGKKAEKKDTITMPPKVLENIKGNN